MHRGIYKTIELPGVLFKNNKTNEEVKDKLVLYDYTANELNIYYDAPIMDDPKDWDIVTNEERINVRDYLYQLGEYNKYFAIISKHSKIAALQNFYVEECNNFYCVEISKEIYDLFIDIGLDSIKVSDNNFDKPLILNNKRSKSSILFYIYSDLQEVNFLLNKYRLKYLEHKLLHKKYENTEVFECISNNNGSYIKTIDNYPYDELNRYRHLVNNNVTNEEIAANNILNENDLANKLYANILFNYYYLNINNIDFNNLKENIFYYGYSNEYIYNNMLAYKNGVSNDCK